MTIRTLKNSIILSMLALITACASAPHIQVADVNAKPVNALRLTCKSPFNLTQDCSSFWGPTKSITIDGVKFKVSGNESSTITLLYGSGYVPHREKNNIAYELVKKELLSHGFQIVSVIPVLNQNKTIHVRKFESIVPSIFSTNHI